MSEDEHDERWTVRLDYTGTITPDEAGLLLEKDGLVSVHTDETAGTVSVVGRVADPSTVYEVALYDRWKHLGNLVWRQAISLDRLTLEGPHARAARLPIVGTAEVAGILGVTTGRVRQLKTDHPDWPQPAAELSAGDLYLADDIRRFAAQWDRRPGPRTTG